MNKLKKLFSHKVDSKPSISTFYLSNTSTKSTAEPSTNEKASLRIIQNCRLIWLDQNIERLADEDLLNTLRQLKEIVHSIEMFTDINACIDFISDIEYENIFLISSGRTGEYAIPVLHDMLQINTIYIFCQNKLRYESWANEWKKIQGVYIDIQQICQSLKRDAQHSDQNSISISFVQINHEQSSNENLNQLDQSFMYTQIFKEIFLTIDFTQEHIDEFISFCQEQCVEKNSIQWNNLEKIQTDYYSHKPIWWYTYDSFLYSMVNRALRTMEIDLLIRLAFFIRHLHEHIRELHSEQFNQDDKHFIVYRGQGLSQLAFEQLKNTEGGLMSFNSFLSTSKQRNIAVAFALEAIETFQLVGILFIIKIDSSISSTPFANIGDGSVYRDEDETLFSMHAIFRIQQIQQLNIDNHLLWQVDLTLTSDNDSQLNDLTNKMREETFPHLKGWYRLGNLLIKLGQFNKAEQVFQTMLNETNDENEKANIFHALGSVKYNQGKFIEAVQFYQDSIQIKQNILSLMHPDLASSYNDMGLAYESMGDDSKSLCYFEKALTIYQTNNFSNDSSLATCYNNIGGVHERMNEYSKAFAFYEKALKIYEQTLPPYHLNLAISLNNIGLIYNKINDNSKALSYYEKALQIYKKTLPSNHCDFAVVYNNIGFLHDKNGEYSKALSFHEKALEIRQQSRSSDHCDLAYSYGHIGMLSSKMGDHRKAITSCQEALKILQNSLPENHPRIQLYQNTLEQVKNKSNAARL